jgi:hypothetical protein
LILANPIYAQVLYENFEKDLEEFDVSGLVAANRVQDARGRLDLRQVLDKFQAFMKAKGAVVSKHRSFREATGQLLLLSYLDLLVNGKGWTFKEPQSGEGRIDVVCCYDRQKEVVELKLWYGARRYAAGLAAKAWITAICSSLTGAKTRHEITAFPNTRWRAKKFRRGWCELVAPIFINKITLRKIGARCLPFVAG